MTAQNAVSIPQYPHFPNDFHIWKTKDNQSMQLINPLDFQLKELLEALSINVSLATSFGVADEHEIRERQDICRDLLQYKKLRKLLVQMNASDLVMFPKDKNTYIEYYTKGKHTAFWQAIHAFLADARGKEFCSTRIQKLVFLLNQMVVVEDMERKIAKHVLKNLYSMIIVEGYCDIRISIGYNGMYMDTRRLESTNVFGYYRFSDSLVRAYKPMPPYLRGKRYGSVWDPRFWVYTTRQNLHVWGNEYRMHRARQGKLLTPEQISQVVGGIEDSAHNHLSRMLSTDVTKEMKGRSFHLRLYVTHGENGSCVRISTVQGIVAEEMTSSMVIPAGALDEIYGERIRRQVRASRDAFVWACIQDRRNAESARSIDALQKIFQGTLFDEIPLSLTLEQQECPWKSLDALFHLQETSDAYEELVTFRKSVSTHMRTLMQVAHVVHTLHEKAQQWELPFSLPTVVEEGHIVAFESLAPVHLYGHANKPKQIIPITGLEPLGGGTVCLTGDHGGGKTVACLTIAQMLYLAQSGLPVFGEGVQFSIRQTIGLVLLERGESSTMQLMAKKMTAVLQAVQTVPRERIVLFIDELGTGTQEAAGFALGKEILDSMQKLRIDLFFSTQIQTLAQYANSNGATCYSIDGNHTIAPGIADGNLEKLLIASGFQSALDALTSPA